MLNNERPLPDNEINSIDINVWRKYMGFLLRHRYYKRE